MATAIDFKALMREQRRKAAEASARRREDEASEFRLDPRTANAESLTADGARASFAVDGAPPEVLYVSEFVTEHDEAALLEKLTSDTAWTQLEGRRLRFFGGVPSLTNPMVRKPIPRYLDQLAARIKECLGDVRGLPRGVTAREETVASEAESDGPGTAARPWGNHWLANEYTVGQGIAWHNDGALYDGVVVVLSLGSTAAIVFRGEEEEEVGERGDGPQEVSLLLEPRSLLVFRDAAYHRFKHCVPARREDAIDASFLNSGQLSSHPRRVGDVVPRDGTRYSLTLRTVSDVTDENDDDAGPLVTDSSMDDDRRTTSAFLRQLTSS